MKRIVLLLCTVFSLFGLDDIDKKILKAAGPVPKGMFTTNDLFGLGLSYTAVRVVKPFGREKELAELSATIDKEYIYWCPTNDMASALQLMMTVGLLFVPAAAKEPEGLKKLYQQAAYYLLYIKEAK